MNGYKGEFSYEAIKSLPIHNMLISGLLKKRRLFIAIVEWTTFV